MSNLICILTVLVALLSLSTSRPYDKPKEKEVPYLPSKPIDCSSWNAAGKALCRNENRLIQGLPLPKNLYEGDLLIKEESKPHHRSRRVVVEQRKWPKSDDGYVYIPYEFGTTLNNVTDAFMQATEDFHRLSCIRLIPRQPNNADHADYIFLFSGNGCFTDRVGRKGGPQLLSLEAFTGCATKGVGIHEILHVLGFEHTMKRRDRDRHIYINYDNMYGFVRYQYAMHEPGFGSVMGENYDLFSIMHYGNYAGSIDLNIPVMTPLLVPNAVMGQRIAMSPTDLIQLNRLYNCTGRVTRL